MTTVEVITSVERRRRWSREEKLRIIAESARPDRTASQVARSHGIAPGQLFTWRRQLLAAAIGDCAGESGFVPVRITTDAVAGPSPTSVAQPIEIRLPSGIVISVGSAVEDAYSLPTSRPRPGDGLAISCTRLRSQIGGRTSNSAASGASSAF